MATETEAIDTPLGAFLAAMGSAGPMLAAASATAEHCPACDATLADFQASGRLGCPTCWETFERPLRDLLRRVHGATRHVGEIPPTATGVPGVSTVAQQRDRLKAALAAAIAAERFEEAAEVRDRLHALGDES